jgi:hypothetical protein
VIRRHQLDGGIRTISPAASSTASRLGSDAAPDRATDVGASCAQGAGTQTASDQWRAGLVNADGRERPLRRQ